MMRKGVTYKGLVDKPAGVGITETKANLRNKSAEADSPGRI